MGLFGFGKNKDKGDQGVPKEQESDLSEEMRILSEVEEETEAEKKARIEAGRLATEAVAQKRQQAEDLATRASGQYIELADDDRFYLVIDDLPTTEPAAPDGLVLSGMVRGRIAVGMEVYLYHANVNKMTTTKVAALSVMGKKIDEISNDRVQVDLERGDLLQAETPDEQASNPLDKYSVLSNVKAHGSEGYEDGPENPKLLGLTLEYARFDSDKAFFGVLAEAAVHSEFITPTQVHQVNGKQQQVGLMSLRDNTGTALFPLFTDKMCLNRNRPENIKFDVNGTLALPFPPAASIGRGGENKGLLINPFGPVTVRLPIEALNGICNSPAYINEFGEEQAKGESIENVLNNVSENIPRPEPQHIEVSLAPPPEAGEYRFMREAIRKYCGMHPDIVKVGIILQTEKGNNGRRAYLCVIDCADDRLADHFKAIVRICRPYMKAVKEMGAIPIAQAPFAEQYFADHEFTYNKLFG